MPTFKSVVIPSNRKHDGTWNVKIRVTHNRVVRYVATPFYVTQSQLTRGYKIKDAKINDLTNQKIKEYQDIVLNIGFLINDIDVDHLIRLLQNQGQQIDFFVYADKYVKDLNAQGRTGTAQSKLVAITSLKRFNNGRPLYFSQIDAQYMYDYYQSLQRLKTNTIRSYIASIRRIYKCAQLHYNDDDLNIIIVKHGVFKLIDLPPTNNGDNTAFTREQMQAIINTPYTGTWMYDFAKDMFILSFVCFGINPTDLFFIKKEQCKNGILTYRRKKIANRNGKDAEMKIKISEIAKIIFDKYSGDSEFLIDFRGHVRNINVCRYIHATFQKAGIEKEGGLLERQGYYKREYVFYTGRHTMATLARNDCGVDYMTVHQMLNHATPRTFKTTDVYIQKNFSPLWEANEKLLALFDWSFYLNQKKNQ